jgi:PilX N-terminal
MMNRLFHQKGVAALTVTLVLTLIATVFVLSTNKNSYIFQKTSVNHYQQVQAFEAAEAGAQATLLQMRRDIEAINSNENYDGVILKKIKSSPPPAPGTNNCGWDSVVVNSDSYDYSEQFKKNNYIFSKKTGSLFQKIGNQEINANNTAWRSSVDLKTSIVSSEGCADESSEQGPFCANTGSDQTAAVVRRGFDIPLKAMST